jgi:hypothetical protein
VAEQLSAAFVEDHAMDSCPETQDRDPEQTKANTPKHNNEVYISFCSFFH